MASQEITLPGAVDLHVHFRQPGTNNAETIESGSRAAMLGGYVLYVDMPNNPGAQTWSEARTLEKKQIIMHDSKVPGAIWAGSQPESDNIGELQAMMQACMGTKFYATKTTGNSKEYEASDFRPIAEELHRIDPTKPIALHAGEYNLADFIGMIAGDFGHPLHVCHVNNARDVGLVLSAKRNDKPVTVGVTPHHLLKTSHDVKSQGVFASMMPPLADQDEAEMLFRQLVNGSIDVIETDHAPHKLQKKMEAEHEDGECFGVPGIEFVIPLLLYQVKKGRISLEKVKQIISTKPAEIIGVNLTNSTQTTWTLDEYRIDNDMEHLSGSGWSPYLGMMAVGKMREMLISGVPIYSDGNHIRKDSRFVSSRGTEI